MLAQLSPTPANLLSLVGCSLPFRDLRLLLSGETLFSGRISVGL